MENLSSLPEPRDDRVYGRYASVINYSPDCHHPYRSFRSKFFPRPMIHYTYSDNEKFSNRVALMELFVMPAKYNKPEKAQTFQQVTFVSAPLSRDQADEFKRWFAEAMADVDTWVAQALSEGYKMSLTDDRSNDCVIFTLTCKDERSPNFNHALSSRADNWLEAVMMGIYKTYNLYPAKAGGWPKERSNFSYG